MKHVSNPAAEKEPPDYGNKLWEQQWLDMGQGTIQESSKFSELLKVLCLERDYWRAGFEKNMNHQKFMWMYLFSTLIYINNTHRTSYNPSNTVFLCGQQDAAVIQVLLRGSSPLKENSLIWYLLDHSPDKNSSETPFLLFMQIDVCLTDSRVSYKKILKWRIKSQVVQLKRFIKIRWRRWH